MLSAVTHGYKKEEIREINLYNTGEHHQSETNSKTEKKNTLIILQLNHKTEQKVQNCQDISNALNK